MHQLYIVNKPLRYLFCQNCCYKLKVLKIENVSSYLCENIIYIITLLQEHHSEWKCFALLSGWLYYLDYLDSAEEFLDTGSLGSDSLFSTSSWCYLVNILRQIAYLRQNKCSNAHLQQTRLSCYVMVNLSKNAKTYLCMYNTFSKIYHIITT